MNDKPLALEVRGFTVHYGPTPVLWDIDVEVPQGHLVGIMGPNGAGKTTFIKAVLGLIGGATGFVRLLNHKLGAVRCRIAYMPQRGQVDWDFPMTVRASVEDTNIFSKEVADQKQLVAAIEEAVGAPAVLD